MQSRPEYSISLT